MSTVLTNGIIIPDNGSRNWGGDLANNWNILDVNVGYMNDVKTKVTTLENSVAENTANIQTNASNISALQTSKQDVIEDLETIRTGASAGATAVQPSALSNYVDLSSEQRITGVKNFKDVVVGEQSGIIRIGNNAEGNLFCTVRYDGQIYNVSKQFVPQTNNEYNLGTSSNKWRNVNTVLLNDKTPAYDSDVVHNNSDETIVGKKTFSNGIYSAFVEFSSTKGANHGGFIDFHYNGSAKDYTSRIIETTEGNLDINGCRVSDKAIYSSDNKCDLGTSTNRFKDIYATNATINTSDRNAKTSIKNIDDNILNAWENVSLVSFKFKDAVEKKGNNARIHAGYIAQDVQEKLSKYGIDACKYGLFCYNSWNAQEEKSHEEERTDSAGTTKTVKVIDTPAREAGEIYGLRYIECLVVECAYLRKKNKELENRIAKLEENLKIVLKVE